MRLIVAITLLLFTLQPAPALADFAAGLRAYDSGDWATALKEWLPLATAGDPYAQRNIGHLYRLGQGVQQDFREAAHWYRRAAEQGHVRAQGNLANMLLRGQGDEENPREAAIWFHRAAVAGDSISQFNIGQMYRQGLAVPQDAAKALGWFKLAAESGHERSTQLVAILTAEGVRSADDETLLIPPFNEPIHVGADPTAPEFEPHRNESALRTEYGGPIEPFSGNYLHSLAAGSSATCTVTNAQGQIGKLRWDVWQDGDGLTQAALEVVALGTRVSLIASINAKGEIQGSQVNGGFRANEHRISDEERALLAIGFEGRWEFLLLGRNLRSPG